MKKFLALILFLSIAPNLRAQAGDFVWLTLFHASSGIPDYGNYMRLSVPSNSLGGITLTLPVTIGSSGYVLTTNGSGTLAWTAPSGIGFVNPMTDTGDIIIGGLSGTPRKLSIGSQYQSLTVSSLGAPRWSAVSLAQSAAVTGLLPISNGGTGASSTSRNFVFVGPTSGSGAPSFRALTAGDLPGATDTGAVQHYPTSAIVNTIQPITDFVPLTINNGNAGYTSDLQEWKKNGTVDAFVDYEGELTASYLTSTGGGQINSTLVVGAGGSSNGQITLYDVASSSNSGILKIGTNSTSRTYTLPDASGTIALVSDIAGFIKNQYTAQTLAGFNIEAGAPAKTAGFIETRILNDATSSTADINKIGLDLVNSGSWSSGIGKSIGLSLGITGGALNYDILGTSNSWSVNAAGGGALASLTLGTPLAIGQGGTGQTTASAALKALLPDSTGNSGKFFTDKPGGGYGWAAAGSGSVTSVDVAIGGMTSSGAITTSGTITMSGRLAIANGGTGAATVAGANYFFANTTGGSAPAFRAIVSGDIPTLNQNTTGTANIAGGTAGAIPYQSAANTTTVLAATATANKILLSGSSAAPVWSTPTFPNASATSGKVIKSNGTNWIASTETYAAPGTSGNIMKSDGTNWTSATPAASGTVTSIVAGTGLSGGTITTTGTISAKLDLEAYGSIFGTSNVLVGPMAGNPSMTGAPVTAFGYQALYHVTTGHDDDAWGTQALYTNTGGYGNEAVGSSALYSNTTGNYNTGIGLDANYRNTTGTGNEAIGVTALYSNKTGNYNTGIGYGADIASEPQSNSTAIGYNAISTASNVVQLGNSSVTAVSTFGDVVITSAGRGLQMKGGSNAKIGIATLSSGTVTVSTTAVTANSVIFLTDETGGVNLGNLSVGTITAGTSFVINSSNVLDGSNVAWFIIEKN